MSSFVLDPGPRANARFPMTSEVVNFSNCSVRSDVGLDAVFAAFASRSRGRLKDWGRGEVTCGGSRSPILDARADESKRESAPVSE